MRVICICTTPFPDSQYPEYLKLLKDGECYSVIDHIGELVRISEVTLPGNAYWYASRFIPLSSIDETQMTRENIKELNEI